MNSLFTVSDDRACRPRIECGHWIYLGLLVILGTGLRLYRIDFPGFTEVVECMYTRTARTIALLFSWGWEHMALLGDAHVVNQQLQQLFARLDHVPVMPYSCKPAFDFINALLVGLVGYEDWTLPLSSAIAGVLSLGAIFLLGTRLYGPRVALIAVALLAVSGGGLVFSRYGQSHMWSLVFFIAGFWAYCHSISGERSWRWLALAAVLMGLTLGVHPNMAPNVGMLAMGEIALLLRRDCGVREVGKRVLVGIGSVVATAVILNFPFVLIKHYAGLFFTQAEMGLAPPFMTYFEQLPRHFGSVFNSETIPPGIAERFYTYVVVLWAWEGLPVAGFVVLAFAWALRGRSGLDFFYLLLLGQIAIPLLFWIFTENLAVYRFSAGVLPSLLLVAAWTLDRLAAHISRRVNLPVRWVVAVLCALLMGYNMHNNVVLYQTQSAYKRAADWLQGEGEDHIVCLNKPTPFWKFYSIEPVDLVTDLDQVRHIAFYRRYMSAREEGMLPALGDPKRIFAHRRPGKLLEVNLMENSVALKLLNYVPGLGGTIDEMRTTVLLRNSLRRLEIYEIKAVKGKILNQI